MAETHDNNSKVGESPSSAPQTLGPRLISSNTFERSGIESLPDEVLIRIAKHCQGKHKVSMLRNLCMVSRHMDSIARQELYLTVSVETDTGLRHLCRTTKENVALSKYIVNLDLLVPGQTFDNGYLTLLDDTDFAMRCSLYIEVLRRTANLRRLTILLVFLGGAPGPWEVRHSGLDSLGYLPQQIHDLFISRLSQLIKQSQRGHSADVVLPFLEHIQLGTDAFPHIGLAQPLLLLPFLDLSSMQSLESFDDSGIWPGSNRHPFRNHAASRTVASETHRYPHIKSMVLRDSNCLPIDVMDVCKVFTAMEVFFCQSRLRNVVYDDAVAHGSRHDQQRAASSRKRYLTHAFEKLQKLQILVLVPLVPSHDFRSFDGLDVTDLTRDFLGPSGFLNLANLQALTSLTTLISFFAAPDGESTGLLTASPMEVLPRSLKTLRIIVDHWSCSALAPRTPLNKSWFQPREAALKFLNVVASFCTSEFPALRLVEYIWAVDRSADSRRVPEPPRIPETALPTPHGELPYPYGRWLDGVRTPDPPKRCDGTVPRCCDMHTRIQALSPDEDYTSRAEGIVSPFKDRFDALGAAFYDADVVFRIVELNEYSDFFSYWQGERESGHC